MRDMEGREVLLLEPSDGSCPLLSCRPYDIPDSRAGWSHLWSSARSFLGRAVVYPTAFLL